MKKITFIVFLVSLSLLANSLKEPTQWGENVTGVATTFQTNKKEIALTFDACGGTPFSKGYDEKLIDFLIENKIPATLFLNGNWINANKKQFEKLSKIDLFELENHGMQHRPLSINGKSIYNRKGTGSKEEILDEVQDNNLLFMENNHKKPIFFRSGTAYYDEIAVQIVKDQLHMIIAGFSINSDYGASASKDTIKSNLLKAKQGDIVIAHMNHPEGFTAEGFMEGLKILKENGFSFVLLKDIKKNLIYTP